MEAHPPIPHLAILPSPGMGHLIPLIEFAKRLLSHHRLTFTFIIASDGPPSQPQQALLNSLPSGIDHLFLPPLSFDDLPPDSKIETIITLTISRSLPSLRNVLKSMVPQSNLVGLVVDLFGTDAFDVAREFNISSYIFFPSTAMLLSFALFLPKLDESVVGEFRDHPEPIKIPGCIAIEGKDLLDPVQDRKNEAYKWTLHNAKRYALADGIFLNSFPELEPGAIKYLREEEPGKPLVYPIGPLVKIDADEKEERAECLKWLDEQPHGSVLFVSFGSGGTLKSAQIDELALGLEMSGQRFIWVVRSPSDKAADATYFSVHSQSDPLGFLPEGFLERTKNRGMVVPSWAPQAQILSHGSTGGFLTHCGWNSTLESVVNGIPLIAWPLYAEQRMNAVMLTEEINVALKPKRNEKTGIVEKEEISKVVKSLLEGEEGKKLRRKMKELKEASEKAVGEDGSSTKIVTNLVNNWKAKIST
ncbi:hydroquinone glucosyltransferase-like [Cucumis melo var. makuwa]|uniref:Glycosyltransferase n=3 Tax=Cucumis melo TaxID=3656 RepID=A0A1S3AV47_CUCME|nr:hydroquinone glucosyltransferase-like [Cucumis melo]ADN34176.1 UDP-glucose:glucosyltransferase [Cucumis melo subsp. melo]KAA0048907.1 hydroquinone glucosyltransferase-like [Cucumis melo var. makuwa]TYK17661.1 hydroquinone glucosyltransferase-like [Cucumis melo var. makuwa]